MPRVLRFGLKRIFNKSAFWDRLPGSQLLFVRKFIISGPEVWPFFIINTFIEKSLKPILIFFAFTIITPIIQQCFIFND